MRVFIVLLFTTLASLNLTAQKHLLVLSWEDRTIFALNLEERNSPSAKIVENIVSSLDLAADENYFYWVDGFSRRINRKDVDNNFVFQSFESNLENPTDIEIDTLNKYIYWVDYYKKTIFRKGFEGSRVDSIISDSLPVALAINRAEKMIYWIDYITKTIKVRPIEGGEIQKIEIPGIEFPIRIAINYSDRKIYVVDHGGHRIYRMDYDGGKQEIFYEGTKEEYPFGIYVDEEDRKIYWTDYGVNKVRRANFDGMEVEDLLDVNYPLGIAIIKPKVGFNLLKPSDEHQSIQVYPNPASQYVEFYVKEYFQSLGTILIYDTSGKFIHQGSLVENPYHFDIKNLQSGLYFYKIQEGKHLFQGKFTIAH